MIYHAKNGREFVGLRLKYGIGKQVVYDVANGKRVLLNILDQSTEDSLIQDALREGVAKKNVLTGIMAALNARSIVVDFTS
jgi:hypothetical protein